MVLPKKTLLLFFFILCFNHINASVFASEDSSFSLPKDSSSVKYLFEEKYELDSSSFYPIDTSLTKFQYYTAKNTLGNDGLPVKELTFNRLSNIGFKYAPNYLGFYKFNKDHLPYFNVKSPYTELFYVVGSKKEQFFRFVHSQNVTPNLNFSASFQRIRSEGYYLRQQTNNNSFSLTSNYCSKDNRYFLLSNIVYNSLKFAENGGLQSDLAFENSTDRTYFSINLPAAQRRENNRGFYVRQYYNLESKARLLKDSIISADFSSTKKLISRNVFSHSFSIEDNSLVYEDANPSSGFYSTIYNDSAKTLDSIYYSKIENEISWRILDREKKSPRNVGLAMFLKHQLLKLNQMEIDSMFNNIIFRTDVFGYFNAQKFKWNASGSYNVMGSNKTDYSLRLNLSNLVGNDGEIGFEGEVNKESPFFIYQKYLSNHFKWENSFNKIGFTSAEFYFAEIKSFFKASFALNQLSNYIYFNKSALPEQNENMLSILSVKLSKDFRLKRWIISNKITYQHASSESPVRIPEFVSEHSVFYENKLFKKALKFQVGLDVFYHSSYFADTYMPATGQFFLQDEKRIGAYPVIDFFMNFKIRRARMFFKIDHLNDGVIGYDYYSALHYPLPGRTLKFGVSWMFFD